MNVLVLMGDHFRHDSMGWCGNRLAHTPNLDRLAGESVRFGNCFAQSPVCSPSRHCMNAGQYAHRTGVVANGHVPHAGMFTLAHALKPHGYRCDNWGHMHWAGGVDNGYDNATGEGWVGRAEADASWPKWAQSRAHAENCDFSLRTSTGGPGPRTAEQHSGHFVMTRAIESIERAVTDGVSFLVWAAFSEPHPPWYPPREFYTLNDLDDVELPPTDSRDHPPHPWMVDRRRHWAHLTEVDIRQCIAGYYGLVAMLDAYVGRILDTLDRLGVADETLVVWASDHGDLLYEHEVFLKFCMRESAVRVPLLIRPPAALRQAGAGGGDRDELVELIDVYPTICEALGVEVPPSVQGRSLAPLLRGDAPAAGWRDAVFSEIEHEQINQKMVRTERWKLNLYDDEPGELYDLAADPGELTNRIHDADQADRIASLARRVREWHAATAG